MRDTYIRKIREGLDVKTLEHFSPVIELPDRELARYADISARTLARRKKEGKLQALLYNDVVVFNDMLTLLRYLYEQNQQ